MPEEPATPQSAVILSDRVVLPGGVGPGVIHVEGGRIMDVKAELDVPGRERLEIDATGLVVLPGGVDMHTHLEMTVGAGPDGSGGVRTADDWTTGSRAAIWGGTTTVVDFLEPGPGEGLAEALDRFGAFVGDRSAVDLGVHVTVTAAAAAGARLEAGMEAVVAAGQPSFKVYTAYSHLRLQEEALGRVLRKAAELGALVMVHCEDGPDIEARVREAVAAGKTSAIWHARTRPPETEVSAVRRVIDAAGAAGARVHLAHLSTEGSVAALREARAAGLAVSGETCPHYLWLEEHRLGWPAPAGLCHVCAPPLREARHLEALWEGLGDGTLDAVATDHCPFDWLGGKDRGMVEGREDFTRTPGGLPGVETRLVLVHAGGVAAGRFGLERMASLVAEGPARLAGLYPRKGVIARGADADLVIFDPDGATRLGARKLHMNVDHSPYEDLAVEGRVAGVMRAGVLVVADDRWLADPAPGRLIFRSAPGAVREQGARVQGAREQAREPGARVQGAREQGAHEPGAREPGAGAP